MQFKFFIPCVQKYVLRVIVTVIVIFLVSRYSHGVSGPDRAKSLVWEESDVKAIRQGLVKPDGAIDGGSLTDSEAGGTDCT